MNYRHAFHAGNFADAFKHVLLGTLTGAMQRKEKPFLFLDTHAGRGRYDLTAASRGDSLERAPEWPDGIGRLWERTDLPAPVAKYLAVVRAFNLHNGAGDGALRFYPGSPVFATEWLRADDRMVATEALGEECTALRSEIGWRQRTVVQMQDGYVALRAFLPPPERRALVLIDPPFEAMDEFERIEAGLRDAVSRLSQAVVAVWYPLTVRSPAGGFLDSVRTARFAPTLNITFPVHAMELPGRLNGCGLLILNPPWQIENEIDPALEYLHGILAREPGARAGIEWLVPE
jgi:23S rRNA (adenine2030-N6)-methyltransferase